MLAVETRDLCHRHPNGGPSLHAIDLRVPEGCIYGFLGANGAGKSTTMRLLLGLLRPASGDIAIFGRSMPQARRHILAMTGAMIESPALYAHLSARENLALLQLARGLPVARIDAVLDSVDLAHTGRRPAGQFSLGMKQRLGIAAALLHAPRLLILDEPTNGLDPNGIVAMRDLLRRLHADGITIVLSSHLLAEIERLADHVGVLHAGRLVFQGTIDALRRTHARNATVTFETGDADAALAILVAEVPDARRIDRGVQTPRLDDTTLARLNRKLVQHGVDVFRITVHDGDLERLYLAAVEETAP